MFEDLDLNVADIKDEAKAGFYPTYSRFCTTTNTSRAICSETSTKYCC